ncbi:response regulator transcription factor [Ornithinimicrobium sp. LYQ121]|uniref:helix-turn-helix transcriptional regulator n=1 Tax=Ornithinimicrobium sp. LYQ121 TaxID=3378801 RepID=UPI00385220D9
MAAAVQPGGPDRRAGGSRISQHFGQVEWARHPANTECLHNVDEIALGYPCGNGRSWRVLVVRESGPVFGPRESTLVELLLPHLREPLAATVVGRARSPLASLTERQTEILRLVALGMPNKHVGRRLGISENTVRKHLENAYALLGVQSRTAAMLTLVTSKQTV